jgi:ankyrin repeat protein
MSLIEAVKNNNIESVKTLIAGGGVDVNNTNEKGDTALYWAVRMRSVECAKILLDAKADVNVKNRYGASLFCWVLMNDRVEFVKLFILCNADIHSRDEYGDSLLHYAVSNGLSSSVEELIRAGAVLDERNEDGYTPLDLAIFCDSWDCVEALLDAGAKISSIHKDVDIPDRLVALLAQRKRVKEALKVLFVLSRPLIGKDVAKIIISMAWETRVDERWDLTSSNCLKKSKI